MPTIKMDDTGYDYTKLEDKYNGFHSPAFHILINNKNILLEKMAITSVTVESSMDEEADFFQFTVENAYDLEERDFQWFDKYFIPGTKVEIKMGYVDKLITVFYGMITAVNFDFPFGEKPVIRVNGMDLSFPMMKGKHSKEWEKKSYSDVAKDIGSKYVSKFEIDTISVKLNKIVQSDMTDYHFLRWIAQQCHYEFAVIADKMYFRKPLKKTTAALTLMYGKHLQELSIQVNVAEQVSSVTVRSWDPIKHELIESEAKKIKKLGSNSRTGIDLIKKMGSHRKDFTLANVESKQEAKQLAEALLNKISLQLVTGYGSCLGIPELRAGKYIKIDGAGKKLNQVYYLTKVEHRIDTSGYVTYFSFGGNAI